MHEELQDTFPLSVPKAASVSLNLLLLVQAHLTVKSNRLNKNRLINFPLKKERVKHRTTRERCSSDFSSGVLLGSF